MTSRCRPWSRRPRGRSARPCRIPSSSCWCTPAWAAGKESNLSRGYSIIVQRAVFVIAIRVAMSTAHKFGSQTFRQIESMPVFPRGWRSNPRAGRTARRGWPSDCPSPPGPSGSGRKSAPESRGISGVPWSTLKSFIHLFLNEKSTKSSHRDRVNGAPPCLSECLNSIGKLFLTTSFYLNAWRRWSAFLEDALVHELAVHGAELAAVEDEAAERGELK